MSGAEPSAAGGAAPSEPSFCGACGEVLDPPREGACPRCGEDPATPPPPPQVVWFEQLLCAVLGGLALWATLGKITPGPAPKVDPSASTQARWRAAWEAGEGRGLVLVVLLVSALALYCLLRHGPRLVREVAVGLRRPRPARPAANLGAFLVAFGLVAVLPSLVVLVGLEPPRLALEGGETLELRRGEERWLAPGEDGEGLRVFDPVPWEAIEPTPPSSPMGSTPSAADTRPAPPWGEGPPPPWLVRARWSLGRGELEAAPITSGAPPLTVNGEPLPAAGKVELWRGTRLAGPGFAGRFEAASWVEISTRQVLGSLLALAVLLTVLVALAPRSLRVLGVHAEGLADEALRGAAGFFAFVPLLYLVMVLSALLAELLGIPAESHTLIRALEQEGGALLGLLVLLNAALVAPLIEELVYRGVALQGLLRPLGAAGALALSALLFAAVHEGFASLLPMLALGALFAALRLGSPRGSLVAPVVAHALYNGLMLTLVLAAP